MKRGYVGLLEGVYLAGRSAGHHEALKRRGIAVPEGSIPLDKMIYLAAFQGGIEEFVTPFSLKQNQPIDSFISKKIITPKQKSTEILSTIFALSHQHVPESKKKNAVMALSFVHDLIAAMDNDASVINVSGIPTIAEVKSCFPAEISLPICNIISQLKPTDELLPAPSLTIASDGIDRFREMLESNVYSQYSTAHKEIEFANRDNKTAFANIRNRGSDLLKTGKGILSRRRVSINVITVLPKIVDAAFGKLPGMLAQTAGDLATKFLDNKRNIIVYQFDDWASEYVNASISHLTDNKNELPKS